MRDLGYLGCEYARALLLWRTRRCLLIIFEAASFAMRAVWMVLAALVLWMFAGVAAARTSRHASSRMAQLRGMFSPPRGSAARWSVRTPWSTRVRSRKELLPEPEHYAEMIGAVSAGACVAAM